MKEYIKMEFINKLERRVLGWSKATPNLPTAGQKWLGVNAWWIVLILAILSGFAILFSLGSLFRLISLLGSASNAYYVTDDFTSIAIISTAIKLVFVIIIGLLLALAVKPLQNMQKKGWVLLFLTLMVQAISLLVSAVLTFSFAGFIVTILFGAIGLAICAYFVFEIHGQFAHTVKTPVEKHE